MAQLSIFFFWQNFVIRNLVIQKKANETLKYWGGAWWFQFLFYICILTDL